MMTDVVIPLYGESYCFALLLDMVLEHCSTMTEDKLNSYHRPSNANAIEALAQAGFLEIVEQTNGTIIATVLPMGRELHSQFLAEKTGAPL